MKDVVDHVRAWTARGDRVAVATVVGVKRSAPRPPGARRAINENGEAVRHGRDGGRLSDAAGRIHEVGA